MANFKIRVYGAGSNNNWRTIKEFERVFTYDQLAESTEYSKEMVYKYKNVNIKTEIIEEC